jgi:hypothetical protein
MNLRQPKQYSVGSVCEVDPLMMDACQAADEAIQILSCMDFRPSFGAER